MEIQQLRMKNFGSFRGEHTIDFHSDTGNKGFAVFGPEGRGKTTLVSSVIWCLYGEIKVSQLFEGQYKTMKRPIIDSDQMAGAFSKTWYPPLLTDQAWHSGEFEMQVRIVFEHNEKVYSLLREAKADKKSPKNDKHMQIKPHLTIDGKVVATALVQSEIEQVIPHRVSKFFFVEADKIDIYASLLFGNEQNLTVREDVEAILGVPALDFSQEDFVEMAKESDRQVISFKKKNKSFEKYERDWKAADENVRASERDMDQANKQLEKIAATIEDIELKLSAEQSAEDLIQKKEEATQAISRINDELKSSYERRSEILSGKMWLSMVQPGIAKVVEDLEARRKEKESLDREIFKIEAQIDHQKNLIEKEEVICEQCGHASESTDLVEKEQAMKKKLELESEAIEKRERSESLGDPSSTIFAISKFRDSIGFEELNVLEKKMGHSEVEKLTQKMSLNKILAEMESHDVETVQKLSKSRKYYVEVNGALKQEKRNLQGNLDYYTNERNKIENKLPDEKDKPIVQEALKKKETFEWLAKKFSDAMGEFKEDARQKVEKHSTEAFLSIVPEPEKYGGISISEKWDITVTDSDGKPKITLNPGHKQMIAISMLDGLRQTSELNFPTFFDNPGSNIADDTLDRMVDHFWSDQTNQVVMLSHGGGLKMNETIEEYGDALAKSWEVSYSEEGTTSQIIELDMRIKGD